ncbi:hypothetical protein SLEP1_g20326 [Rubroshorea leprosula]|uniref:Uncharacterized protein n=1 Tax=Rubroshorea leprosula TaxID=152421 RepID=A0AAV5J2B8_9ROSI|nr:hypothetical protein SLEP1_g20324 [Rubroshorea leprosula]GKV08734.1 hypothetical protein SLEP1_g20326 [Rubroshorea leprosula]
MKPTRTLGPAVASSYYKGLWVYFIGPVIGTLLGARSYGFIRETDKPVQGISPRSFSLKLHRMRRSTEESVSNKDPDTSLRTHWQSLLSLQS